MTCCQKQWGHVMSRTLKIGLAIGGGLLLLAVIALFLIPVNQFGPALEAHASAALGRKVDLGRLRLSIFSQSLSTETLAVADDPAFNASPFLTAKSVKVRVRLWPLIVSRSLDVTGIAVDNPEVTLIRNAAGQWNYSSLGASSTLSESSIKKLELKNWRIITGSTTSRQRSTYDHVTITVSDVSSASGSPMSATGALAGDGGTFALAGTVGPLDHADASLTPFVGTIAVNHLNLATSGFLSPSVGLGGLLDLKATIASKSYEASVAGSATVSHAVLVAGGSPASEPMVVAFDTRYNLRKHSGVLNPSTLKIGDATGRLHGTYNASGDHTVVGLKVVGEHMPARDVARFLPALALHLPRGTALAAGTVAADLNVAGATNALVTAGAVGLFNAKLVGFDLGAKVRAISGFTGLNTGSDLDIHSLTTNVRIAPNGLRFDRFNAVVPSLGYLTGAGTIDATNHLDFKMVATLTTPLGGGIGAATATAGVLNDVFDALSGGGAARISQSRGQRIPFLVQGTTSEPIFIPDVSGVAIQMLKDQVLKPPVKPQDLDPLGMLGHLFNLK